MNKPLDLSNTKVYTNTKEDAIKALSLIGEYVYMSDYEDFKEYTKGELIGVSYTNDSTNMHFPFLCRICVIGSCAHYKYFILEKDAKFEDGTSGPSYRKLKSIDEFEYVTQNYFNIGESVIIRNKKTHNVSELVYGGYFVNDHSQVLICLGPFVFTFDDLFKDYEFRDSCFYEWIPFGIKE